MDMKPSDRYATDLWQTVAAQALVPNNGLRETPYDTYCPSLKTEVKKRTCADCGVYFPSQAAIQRHRRGGGCYIPVESDEEFDEPDLVDSASEDEEDDGDDEDDRAPILNIFEMLAGSAFMDED